MYVPVEYRCEFARTTKDCNDNDALVHYGTFLACHFVRYPTQMYLGLLPLVIIAFIYFLTLSIISDLFTPSLCYVSNVLGLSETFAGATLLAFGNASPDLITSMVGALKLGAEQIVAQVLGGSMFLTTVVVAAIIITRPFRIIPQFFVRNQATFILALVLIFIIYRDDKIYLYEAIAFILIYAFYIGCFFITDKKIKYRSSRMVQELIKEEDHSREVILVHKGDTTTSASGTSGESSNSDVERSKLTPTEKVYVTRRRTLEGTNRQRLSHRGSLISSELSENLGVDVPSRIIPRETRKTSITNTANSILEVERMQSLRQHGLKDRALASALDKRNVVAVDILGQRVVEKKRSLFSDFIVHMNPINEEEWVESSSFYRTIMVMISPLVFLCRLLVPCIDETVVCNNWCKLLLIIQCIYLPPFVAWGLGLSNFTSFDIYIPIYFCLLLLGIVMSAMVATSSEVDEAPSYHIMVAICGFLVSLVCIFLVANELMAILVTVGQILSMSVVTITIIVLPWGNSVGDFVNGITLAKAGYSRMAYTGIYGSNLLTMLIGVGFSFLLMVVDLGTGISYENPSVHTGMVYNTYFFLGCSCILSVCMIPTVDYQLRRSQGVVLLALYFMFFIFSLLTEYQIITPLG